MNSNKTLYFFLLILSLSTACRKDNSAFVTEKDTDDETNPNTEFYFKGNLNNQAFLWQVTPQSNWNVGTFGHSMNDKGTITGSYSAWIADTSEKPSLHVTFKTYHVPLDTDKTVYFNSFIKAGTLPYSPDENFNPGTKEVIIKYVDNQGKEYTSLGAQTTSIFTIVSVTQIPASLGHVESLKIKMTLNCKLYPTSGTGDALILSNGSAVLFMENQL